MKSGPVTLFGCGDLHCGSTLALCPKEIRLDDGGHYRRSKQQGWLMDCWGDALEQVDTARRENKGPLYCVIDGDLVEGQVKFSTQILNGNPNAQAAVVNAVLAPLLALRPDRIYIIRGTEAHVGQSASAEERIADGLRRDKRPIVGDPDTGTASWWHCRLNIQGVKLDITHHGRTGLREHTRGGAAVLHAHDIFLSYTKNGEPAPDLCLRGHHHKFNDSGDACPVRVVTMGAFQLKTSYAHRVAADSLSDIGGVLVTIDKGEYDLRKLQYKPERVWHPG